MSFTPGLFFSHMNGKGGPARNNRFQVIIPIPNYLSNYFESSLLEKIINFPNSIYSDITSAVSNVLGNFTGSSNNTSYSNSEMTRYLSLVCEDAELPGKTFELAEGKIYGPTFKVPHQVVYHPITLTFICTNEFEERKLFDLWLEAIMPLDTNNMRYPKGSNSYLTDITVIQYNELFGQIYASKLIDAFPVGIGSQRLNWGSNEFHRVSVQFYYYMYKTIYNQSIGESIQQSLTDGTSALLGTYAASFIPKSL